MSSNAGRWGGDIVPSGTDQSLEEASIYLESIVVDMGSSLSMTVTSRVIVDRLESIVNAESYLRNMLNYSASEQDFGTLEVTGGSEIFLRGNLLLDGFDIDLDTATLRVYGNVTIGSGAELRVAWNQSTIDVLDATLFTYSPSSSEWTADRPALNIIPAHWHPLVTSLRDSVIFATIIQSVSICCAVAVSCDHIDALNDAVEYAVDQHLSINDSIRGAIGNTFQFAKFSAFADAFQYSE
ncbi:unnamed protein product [Symbiodinium microadriaticum]|nr:unnamed protein product [Symbiodinium microadriaticum]